MAPWLMEKANTICPSAQSQEGSSLRKEFLPWVLWILPPLPPPCLLLSSGTGSLNSCCLSETKAPGHAWPIAYLVIIMVGVILPFLWINIKQLGTTVLSVSSSLLGIHGFEKDSLCLSRTGFHGSAAWESHMNTAHGYAITSPQGKRVPSRCSHSLFLPFELEVYGWIFRFHKA